MTLCILQEERSDEQLLLDYRNDCDEDSFNEFHRRMLRPVYLLCKERATFANEECQVEDLVQETFMSVVKGIHTYDPEQPAKAWVRTIAANVVTRHHQTLMRDSRCPEGGVASLDAWCDSSGRQYEIVDDSIKEPTFGIESEELWALVDTLPKATRAGIRAHYHDGLTMAEMAEKMDIPLGTALTRCFNGLRRLREHFNEED